MADEMNQAPPGGDSSAQQQPTQEQQLANLVNAAVTSQLKRILPKAITDALGPAIAPLKEQLAPKQEPAPQVSQAQGDPAVQAQIDELKKQLKREQDARANERRTAREANAFSALRSELTGKVRPEAVDHATKLLFHAEKAISVSDSGDATFKYGDDEYPLKEGVAAWLKSKDAALYLPAPGYGATKTLPARRPMPGISGVNPQGLTQPHHQQSAEDPIEKTQRMLAERGINLG